MKSNKQSKYSGVQRRRGTLRGAVIRVIDRTRAPASAGSYLCMRWILL
jgi:hypothetical protein